jgi:N utilization substance protein B
MTSYTKDNRLAARLLAVQALYQMELAGTSLDEVIAQFQSHNIDAPLDNLQAGIDLPAADADFFEFILRGVIAHQVEIDRLVDSYLGDKWQLARLDSTLRAILRCGVQELAHGENVPKKVVISQYVDLAHAFFDGGEGGMANALLDNIAQQLSDNGLAGG